jgi:hypothetical protein
MDSTNLKLVIAMTNLNWLCICQFSIGWGYDQFLLVILGNSTLTDQKKLVKFTILNWLKIQPIMYWSK